MFLRSCDAVYALHAARAPSLSMRKISMRAAHMVCLRAQSRTLSLLLLLLLLLMPTGVCAIDCAEQTFDELSEKSRQAILDSYRDGKQSNK